MLESNDLLNYHGLLKTADFFLTIHNLFLFALVFFFRNYDELIKCSCLVIAMTKWQETDIRFSSTPIYFSSDISIQPSVIISPMKYQTRID